MSTVRRSLPFYRLLPFFLVSLCSFNFLNIFLTSCAIIIAVSIGNEPNTDYYKKKGCVFMKHNRNTKSRKTFLSGILALALVFSTLLPVPGSDAASVKISKKNLTLEKGQSYPLKIKGTKKKVTWKSGNKKIASVTKKGVVKAKKKGKTTITAKVMAKKYRCSVTVKAKKAISTARPANTNKPAVTVKPTVTNKPAATVKPAVTNKPAVTCKPGIFYWPFLSARPTATSKPAATVKPTVTNKPTVTVKPAVTNKPAATVKPTVTQSPSSSGMTESEAYRILNSLRSTYPEGMPLTNSYYYYSPRFGNGYGCYGFAAKLSDTVFGVEKNYTTHSTFANIRVGDNIRIGNYHSVIVLTKSSEFITVVEGNYNSSVHWDRKITKNSLAQEGFRVYTRY